MRRRLPMLAKAAAAAVALVLLLLTVVGYLGEYRSAKGGGPEKVPTSTVDATATPGAVETTGTGRNVMTPPASGATVVVQIEGLNLRTKPESDAEVMRGLGRGERLRWVSSKTGWYQVTDKDGRTGWVSANPQYATLEK